MLTITIFATIVSDMLPVSNNTPLIGRPVVYSQYTIAKRKEALSEICYDTLSLVHC